MKLRLLFSLLAAAALPAFAAQTVFQNPVVATNPASQFKGTFSGNGAGLTNMVTNVVYTTPAKLSADLAAVRAGQWLWFTPGDYITNNLLRVGVNYYFAPGARVFFWDQSNSTNQGPGYGLFDDRATGATTNIIAGDGDFYYNAGTNPTVRVDLLSLEFGTNQLAAFVFTNAATSFDVRGRTISVAGYIPNDSGGLVHPTVMALYDASTNLNKRFDVDTISCVSTDSIAITNEALEYNFLTAGKDGGLVLGGAGVLHFHCKHMGANRSYGLTSIDWRDLPSGTNYIAVDQMDSTINLSSGDFDRELTFYFDFKRQYCQDSGDGAYILEVGGDMNVWYRAQHAYGIGEEGVFLHPVASRTNLNVYFTADTLSIAPQSADAEAHLALINNAGKLLLRVGEYSQYGKATTGAPFWCRNSSGSASNACLIVDGGTVFSTNAAPIYEHVWGGATFKNVTFVQTNAAVPPFGVYTNGLVFENCKFVCANTNVLYATNAQKVGIYGHCMSNKGTNANITFEPAGVLQIDANVK